MSDRSSWWGSSSAAGSGAASIVASAAAASAAASSGRGLRVGLGLGPAAATDARLLGRLVAGAVELVAEQVGVALLAVQRGRLDVGGLDDEFVVAGLGDLDARAPGGGLPCRRRASRRRRRHGGPAQPELLGGGAQHARRVGNTRAGGLEHTRHRGAGDQQDPGQEQEEPEDVAADRADEARGDVEQQVAEVAATLAQEGLVPEPVADPGGAEAERPGGEHQRQGEHEQDPAGAERPHAGQHRAQHDDRAGGDEAHRRDVAQRADGQRERVEHAVAGAPAVPVQVQREDEEDAAGHERQPEEVQVALLEQRQPRRPRRRRAARTRLAPCAGGSGAGLGLGRGLAPARRR